MRQRVHETTLQVNEDNRKCEGTLVWLYTPIWILLVVKIALPEIENIRMMKSGKVEMVIFHDC